MSRDFLGSLSHPLSPPLPTRAHLRFPLSFLFSVSSVSLNPMATLRGDVSLTACVLIRIWCVSCLTQNPAGWTFTSSRVAYFPAYGGDDSYILHQVWVGLKIWEPAWIAQLESYVELPQFSTAWSHHISNLWFLIAWRSQGSWTSYMAAGFLPERKQMLPGLLKPGLWGPGTFLSSHAISESNYKASPDSGGEETPHVDGVCAYREGRNSQQLSLEMICHSEKVPILFLHRGDARG